MQSDLDQAARYLRYACELLEREGAGKTTPLRKSLDQAARRLNQGDGAPSAEIPTLRDLATRSPIATARTEILKAVAVLHDKRQ